MNTHTWIFENAVDLCEYVIKKKNVFDYVFVYKRQPYLLVASLKESIKLE